MINDHGTACQCSQCQMHVQSMSTTVPLDRPSPPAEPKCGRCGHDKGDHLYGTLGCLPTRCDCDTYRPPATPAPADEDDGHCTVCGLEMEDPKELEHECPPGFLTEPAERCPHCPHAKHGEICNEYPNGFRCRCGSATTEPAESELFVPPDPTAEYREGDIDKFFGCMSPAAPATPELAESEGKGKNCTRCDPSHRHGYRSWIDTAMCLENGCPCSDYQPPTAPPAETEDAKAFLHSEPQSHNAWLWSETGEQMMQAYAEQYAAKQIERQTPAIIEQFVEDVAKEMVKNQYDYPHDYEKAMQTVKARREGGESK